MPLVDFAPHNMTSDSTPAPYVVTYYTPSYFPGYFAFGASESWYWIGNSPTESWLQIFIGSTAKLLDSYGLKMNTIPEPNRAPKDWTISGSNNGTIWTVIDTQTNQTSWGSGEKRDFECDDKSTAYKYFKINISANNGDANYTQIKSVYLYEVPIQYYHKYLQYRGRSRLNLLPISSGHEKLLEN